ncbi:MAG: tRNA (adenosine(37)-N6)-threonylcarbamoyltransferase complex dimerization subunit type 1 TsaB [Firmicutes bacterium]|nr:tRNA (adenosine(37)-N6)-threonylcarbamoyltransferase complex dimerization subunit type 1 TsaB [Bacillota bacterium]
MYILAIETTGAFASVALMKDDKIIGHVSGNDRFSHLQNLMPQVETVIKENKLSIGDIDLIAVSNGPGSFTGIRIGVSTARALSQILDIPCVAVPSLDALALRGGEYAKAHAAGAQDFLEEKECPLLICPMLDARRSQVYAGGYFIKDGYPVEEIKAGPYMLDEFLAKAAGYDQILVLGDAMDKYADKMAEIRPEGTLDTPEDIRYQDASCVAALGAKLYAEKGGLSYNEVQPEYMRMAEAERKLKEQQAKG